MAVTSDEDGFREIQLNGKQLVFLFMAATVVLVVTFLTGVLVGRGVRAERAEAAQAEALTDSPATPERAPLVTAAGDDPRTVTPPPAVEEEPPVAAPRQAAETATPGETTKAEPRSTDLPRRNEPTPAAAAPAVSEKSAPPGGRAPAPVANSATTAANRTAPAASKSTPPAATKNTPPAAAKSPAPAAPVATAPPSGPRNGYAVQVAAVNVRGEAEAIVQRLSGKGYSAYVEVPRNNASVFRVRVGTFRTRSEAQTVAEKLRKEEKFKPWVTR